jgi:hypothetical protein
MAQGWTINATADKIDFFEPPPVGTGNVVVTEYARGAVGGTDVWAAGAWSYRYGYPGEVEFYADRLWFAGSPTDPQTAWASNIGDYNNFGRSSPIVDSDAVSFTINLRQVNAIRDLVPLDNLLILTSGSVCKMTTGQDDVVTPSTVGIKPQSYYGTSKVQAKVLGESAIFIEEAGQRIRDLSYQFDKDGFRGNEISIWADHLIKGHTFRGIESAPSPWSVLWFPRDDGVLIGCTYVPEQEVIGWHRHDTQGEILDMCCLPSTDETDTYALVRRVVNGVSKQYIEQLAPTRYTDQADYKYLDSCLTYDGRNTTNTTITITSAGDWTETAVLTLTASAALFVGAGDVDDGFEFIVGDERARLRITEYVSATQVRAYSIGTLPVAMRGTPLQSWTFQRSTISGLDHLEGLEVVALVDGNVHAPRTVASGTITLQEPAGVAQIGLQYTAHVETLEANNPGGESMRPAKKLPFKVDLQVLETRGISIGVALDLLDPLAQREYEDYDVPTTPFTGVFTKTMTCQWGKDAGHFHILSDDPLPMEILALIPSYAVSD